MKRTLSSSSFWFALLLLLANGAAWAYALAPGAEGPAAVVEPRLEPQLADLRQRLIEGGHGGEPFVVEVTDQEAAETIAWYLERHPGVPFGQPQVFITPAGVTARGVGQVAGLRVGVAGTARIILDDGVPLVTLANLDVAGVAVPAFVRSTIQSEIDAQFALAQNLPVRIDELLLEEGKTTIRGIIR